MFNESFFSLEKSLGIIIPVVILSGLTICFLKERLLKFYFLLFSFGFLAYSGIGYGYFIGIAKDYKTYYIIFFCVFCLSIVLFSNILKFKWVDYDYVNKRLDNLMSAGRWVQIVIVGYFFTFLFELVYPEFNLGRLLSPPRPDIIGDLQNRFNQEGAPFLTTLFRYIRIVLYPFYLIGLIKMTKNIYKFMALLFLPLYLEYCSNAYLGRSAMLLALIFVFMLLWKFRPELKKKIVVITAIIVPLFIVFSFVYQSARNSQSKSVTGGVGVEKAFEILLTTETSFPVLSAEIIDGDERTDLFSHLSWAATLPVPKLGLFKFHDGLPAYEISEILTKKRRTSPGFWVPLSGYLTENVFVYGKFFFWVPAVIVAFYLSLFGKLLSNIPLLYGFSLFIGLTIGYNLNRAGIQSALPLIINNNLLIYSFIIMLITKTRILWKTPFGLQL